jgi:4-amino-4-deoxy-L-arabinose transferase-like glycosyltransferase
MLAIIKRKIFLLFLLAFVIRLIVFLLLRPWDGQVLAESVLVNDASEYHRFALSIIDHFSFEGETYRTPGYPFFIAVIYVIFGVKPWLVLFIQIFVDLATIYYVMRIGELLFSRRVGIIAAAFLAIDPNSIFTTARFLSDGLSVAFLMASMYFYLRGLKRGDAKSFFKCWLFTRAFGLNQARCPIVFRNFVLANPVVSVHKLKCQA